MSLVDYGAFVEIEEGVEGLIHVSEMSWTKKVVNPAKLLNVGDEVEAIVSELDMDQRRISLSLRQTERNPWEELADTHPEGTVIEGKVRNLTEFGAFVEITEGIDGLIHVSDMSWTKRVKHPSEVLKKGDTVKARITNIDAENQRVSLSIKEFMPNEWDDFVAGHKVGDAVDGKVVNVTDFGLFIDIYHGLEGLAHISEIDVPAGAKLEDHFEVGDWVRARILRIEDDEKKVGLTMRGLLQPSAEEAAELTAADEARHGGSSREAAKEGAVVDSADAGEAPSAKKAGRRRAPPRPPRSTAEREAAAEDRGGGGAGGARPGRRRGGRGRRGQGSGGSLRGRRATTRRGETVSERDGMTKAELVEEVARSTAAHQEARRDHRQHGLRQHRPLAQGGREDRAARLRQLPHPPPRPAHRPQPEDRGEGRGSRQAHPLLQAGQGAAGAAQRRIAHTAAGGGERPDGTPSGQDDRRLVAAGGGEGVGRLAGARTRATSCSGAGAGRCSSRPWSSPRRRSATTSKASSAGSPPVNR